MVNNILKILSILSILVFTGCGGGSSSEPVVNTATDESSSSILFVSETIGNTASYNSIASFQLSMNATPTHNVTIPLSSSNELEGIVTVDEIIFTPQNWNIPQTVYIIGRNNDVVNGQQNYSIILGSIKSDDSKYNDINPDDVNITGISIDIQITEQITDLLSDITTTIELTTTYNGDDAVIYTLMHAPSGMTIDSSLGTISWIPLKTDEGNSYEIQVNATDETYTDEFTFSINVVETVTVQTTKTSEQITVEDPTSSLNGINIVSATDLTNQDIRIIPESSAPSIPSHINRISDIFIFSKSIDGDITLDIPINLLAGNDSSSISLYTYYNEDVPNIWFKQFAQMEIITDSLSNEFLRLQLTGTGVQPYFIGIDTTNVNRSRYISPPSFEITTSTSGTITCSSFPVFGNNVIYICSDSSDPEIDIKIFGDYYEDVWKTDEVINSPADIAKWAVDSQDLYDQYGLTYDKSFIISLDNLGLIDDSHESVYPTTVDDCSRYWPGLHGFVSRSENYKILHLNSTICNQGKAENMRSTTLHEYFHQSQDRSAKDLENSVIKNIDNRQWITEGTAKWIQAEDNPINVDDIFIPKFLEVGLNAPHSVVWRGYEARYNAYLKFPYWELIANQCSFKNSSKIVEVFSLNQSEDSAIDNFIDSFDEINCDFDIELGSSNQDDFAESLLRYQYEVFYNDSTTLGYGSEFDRDVKVYNSDNWFLAGDGNEYISQTNWVARVSSAKSFIIALDVFDNIDWDDESNLLTLDIRTSSESEGVIVSIMSKSASFEGTATNLPGIKQKILKPTTIENKYTFEQGDASELFITIINPTTRTIVIDKFQLRKKKMDVVALKQNLEIIVNTSAQIILEGSDKNNLPLTYTIVDRPTNGSLRGSDEFVSYTPNNDYIGIDSFTFFVSNGSDDSKKATVTINVKADTAYLLKNWLEPFDEDTTETTCNAAGGSMYAHHTPDFVEDEQATRTGCAFTWIEANSYCMANNARLPTIQELKDVRNAIADRVIIYEEFYGIDFWGLETRNRVSTEGVEYQIATALDMLDGGETDYITSSLAAGVRCIKSSDQETQDITQSVSEWTEFDWLSQKGQEMAQSTCENLYSGKWFQTDEEEDIGVCKMNYNNTKTFCEDRVGHIPSLIEFQELTFRFHTYIHDNESMGSYFWHTQESNIYGTAYDYQTNIESPFLEQNTELLVQCRKN